MHGAQRPAIGSGCRSPPWSSCPPSPLAPLCGSPSPGQGGRVDVGQLAEKVVAATKAAGEGKNFSPTRAKGYQFGMVAVFDSVDELDGKVGEAKAALRPLLDELMVLDFAVDAGASTCLCLASLGGGGGPLRQAESVAGAR